MAKKQTNRLTNEQRDIVRNMLEASLVRLDDGQWEYRDDYNDALVAKRAGVTEYAVRQLRGIAFGPLKSYVSGQVRYGALVEIVKKQGEQIASLEARLSALTAPRMTMAASEPRSIPINGTMR